MKVKAGNLIIDERLTKLRPINQVFVSRYRQAYRMGAKFPPIIVEKGTNRVVSGNHRLTAFLSEFGPDKEICVDVRSFESEKEVLETFAKENATHGNALDTISKKRLTFALISEGASVEEVAKIFNIPVKTIEKWGDKVVAVIGREGRTKYSAPVKRGVVVEDGVVEERRYEEHIESDRGITFTALAKQLIRWLNNGWIKKSDKNIDLLQQLEKAIDGFLKSGGEKQDKTRLSK